MEYLRLLAGPVVGAVIGYITNYIAIKMLFRPLTAKYVFGIKIPFTPGIIPRRKSQLADALGRAVFARFFNWDDLEVVFLSDTFSDEVAGRIEMALRSERTVGDLTRDLPAETADAFTKALAERLKDSLIGSGIIRKTALESMKEKPSDAESGENESAASRLAVGLAAAYAGPVSERVEQYLKEEGEQLITSLLENERENLDKQELSGILDTLFPEEGALKAQIREVYLKFMRVHVRPIVESIDIVSQITGKMNSMGADEVEGLVLAIVSRELKMVVRFGAFLGAVIGVVNIFI